MQDLVINCFLEENENAEAKKGKLSGQTSGIHLGNDRKVNIEFELSHNYVEITNCGGVCDDPALAAKISSKIIQMTDVFFIQILYNIFTGTMKI